MIPRTLIQIAVIGLAFVHLAGCGGNENEVEIEDAGYLSCPEINGNTFYSTTLEEGGATPTGIARTHWQISFKDGDVQLLQSDFGLSGTYRCRHNYLEMTLNTGAKHAFLLRDDYSEFDFNPLGGDRLVTYRIAPSRQGNADACQLVKGKRFVYPESGADLVADPVSDDTEKGPAPHFHFSDGQSVDYGFGGDILYRGFYECATGELHVHDFPAHEEPHRVQVGADGNSINVITSTAAGERELRLVYLSDADCPPELQSVCGVEPQQVQCITAPCPTGFYKTFFSLCAARQAGAFNVTEGDCGAREGLAYTPPVGCDAPFKPVCGAVANPAPCDSVACPAVVYQTFDNFCEAHARRAQVVQEFPCGELEGDRVTEVLPTACPPIVGPPECVKSPANIVCVTEPCASHVYQTFNGFCASHAAIATPVFPGECGLLEGVRVSEEPPAILVDALGSTEKPVRISNVAFVGDTLSLELGYAGCSAQYFELRIYTAFAESAPVQAAYLFKPMFEDDCDAAFQTRVSYDLTPLKYLYQQEYKVQEGQVVLPGIGTYSF